MYQNSVKNFVDFPPLGLVLVVMVGIGVAEGAGLFTLLIRFLVSVAPPRLLTASDVAAAILSHLASEAGYVVLIPLGAAMFHAIGRHPMAGLAAAFCGVSGGFGANFLIGSVDPVLAGLTQSAANILAPAITISPVLRLDDYGDWLHQRAGVTWATILDGIGFAPGLSNVTVGDGLRKLDVAESAVARVGGIPSKAAAERHPLRYMIRWAFWHVLREYMIKVNVLKNGRIVEVQTLTDRERFRFTQFGKDEWLECAVTSGMPSFIFTRPTLKDFAEKTVRWPGHFDGVDTLKACGMLDLEPVAVKGAAVAPRDVLLAAIEPRLRAQPGDTHVCVMHNNRHRDEGRRAGPDHLLDVGRGRPRHRHLEHGPRHRVPGRDRRVHDRQGHDRAARARAAGGRGLLPGAVLLRPTPRPAGVND